MRMMVKATATCLPLVSFAQDKRSSTRVVLALILFRISVVSLADASSMLPSAEAIALLPDTLNLVHSSSRAVQPEPSVAACRSTRATERSFVEGNCPSAPAPVLSPVALSAFEKAGFFNASFKGVSTFSISRVPSA